MGAQGKASAQSNSMQRVKVYRLNENGKWDDWGTGHVTVDFLEKTEDLGLIVIDEEDSNALLAHCISSEEIYLRQEDTIISWRDPTYSTDLALSFQEPAGCSYIWDQICSVRRNLQFCALRNMETNSRPSDEVFELSGASHPDKGVPGTNGEIRELPPLGFTTLPLILKIVLESGAADQVRVADLILQEQNFFPKLVELFKMSEDLENMDSLHMIFKLVKGIILLNNHQIFEKSFGNGIIMDIIGALEYDPEVPQMQHHRAFIKEHVVFKEAIPIKDSSVLSKIHQSYRIGYIKDVILPRVLDEPTITSLNSIIRSNNVTVVSALKDDTSFIQELFARMKSPATCSESKRNLVLFLQEFCSLSKSLQLVQQLRLFRDLASEGVFGIITEALKSHDRKLISAGTDILILFLNQDPNLLRSYVIQQEGQSLLGLLVKGVITDIGENMHCQFLEIIRILLDSYTLSGSQREVIVEIFYEKHLEELIDAITSTCPSKNNMHTSVKLSGPAERVELRTNTKPEVLLNICDLLCFCVLHHPYRIKCNFLLNNVIEKVMHLTRRKEKYLVVAAVRFMRTIISRNDDHILRHIVKNNLFKPIMEAFMANENRYNMLHSGVLELLEHIRKDNAKILIKYVVENFWDLLSKFENFETIMGLKVKYEQSLEKYDAKASTITVEDPRKRPEERGLEKEEEDYFNEDSDEEDSASVSSSGGGRRESHLVLSNGSVSKHAPTRTLGGGLVDYEDDDDDDDDYNPPPKKIEPVSEDKIAELPSPKRKPIAIDILSTDPPSIKRLKLDNKHRSEHGQPPHISCGSIDSLAKKKIAAGLPRGPNGNNGPAEQKCEKSVMRSSTSNHISNPEDVRQSGDGLNKSSPKVAADSTNHGGSESPAVR